MAETGARATRTGKTFQDGYAQRIVTVIDDRIARATKSEAGVETTWGQVAEVSADGQVASAYLYGDTDNPSVGFRVRGSEVLSVGDKIKVAVSSRGDKWVVDRNVSTAYRKVEIDQATGEVRTGDGTAPPTARLTSSGHTGLPSVAHSALTGVTADQHHAQSHSHASAGDGTALAPVSVTIGSTPDIRFTRSGTKVLVVDDGAGGGLTTIDLLGAVALRLGGDVSLSRGAADRLDLASGDSLRVSDTGQVQWSDVTLGRASAGLLEVSADLKVTGGELYIGSDILLSRTGTQILSVRDQSFGNINVFDIDSAMFRAGGSSFPGSPASDDLFYRTDDNMWFFWDGTRWLSVERRDLVFPVFAQGITVSSNVAYLSPPPLDGMSDYWLETVRVSVFVGGGGSALSASHKWVGVLQKTQQDSATNTTLTTINLDSGSSSVWRDFEVTLDVLLNNGTIHDSMQFVWTKTGTPGTLTTALTLVYRLVET